MTSSSLLSAQRARSPSASHHPHAHHHQQQQQVRSDIMLQLARGLELVRRHRWAHALTALTACLELDAREPKALEHRARCFLMLGRMNEALSDAEALVQVDRQRNEAHHVQERQQIAAQTAILQQAAANLSPASAAAAAAVGSPVAHSSANRPTSPRGNASNQRLLKVASPLEILSASATARDMLQRGGQFAKAARAALAIAQANSPVAPEKLLRGYELLSDSDDDDNNVMTLMSTSHNNPGAGDSFALSARKRHLTTSSEAAKARILQLTGSSAQRSKGQLLRAQIMSAARAEASATAAEQQQGQHQSSLDAENLSPHQRQALLASAAARRRRGSSVVSPHSPTILGRRPSSASPSPHRHHQQQQRAANVSPPLGGGGVINFTGGNNASAIPMKWYVGVLLRAQVLFAMGCFEEACRQFHEGQRARPDVEEFATGVAECEHILMGAVHPWRRRQPSPPKGIERVPSRPNSPSAVPTLKSGGSKSPPRPMSRGEKRHKQAAASRTSSSGLSVGNEADANKQQQQQQQRRWHPPRPHVSYDDKEVKLCMPEMADDYFFLRKLRQHPRIFDTGVGAGIARGQDTNPVIRQITRQLQTARKLTTSAMAGARGAFAIKGGVGDASADLTGQRFSSAPSAAAGGAGASLQELRQQRQQKPLGADKVPGLFGETPFAGPAQLTAFCAAAAAEAAEEDMQKRQAAALLAHAEEQAERAARSQRGTVAHTPGTAEAKTAKEASTTASSSAAAAAASAPGSPHGGASRPASGAAVSGIFGGSLVGGGGAGGDDDDGRKRRRRDFHVRPPDTRSWGVQSARGRRRMKEGVDTTLQYLSTQQRFWAHRDERTNIPSLDEPDLPPRFRPASAAGSERNNNNNSSSRASSASRPGSAAIERLAQPKRQRPSVGAAAAASKTASATVGAAAAASGDGGDVPYRLSVSAPTAADSRRGSSAPGHGDNGAPRSDLARRRSSILRTALRPVATADADALGGGPSSSSPAARRRSTVQAMILHDFQLESRRASMDPSIVVSSSSGDNDPFKLRELSDAHQQHYFARVRDIPAAIDGNTAATESRFVADMHQVFKLMAQQHETEALEGAEGGLQSRMQRYGGGGSSSNRRSGADDAVAAYFRNRKGRRGGGAEDGGDDDDGNDDNGGGPKLTSSGYNFVQSRGGDDVNECVLAVPRNDGSSASPAPVFASANLRSVYQGIQMALSRGAAEVVQDEVRLAQAAAGAGGGGSGSLLSQQHQAAMAASARSSRQQQSASSGADDLARIQRALFDNGEDAYLIVGGAGSGGNRAGGKNNSSSPVSQQQQQQQQRAVTLRWGEYDGLHFGEDDGSGDGDASDTAASGGGGENGGSGAKAQKPHDLVDGSPDEATARRYRARQHARHQRARALLAHSIRKEYNVDLPYEAVFRVPLKQRDASSSAAAAPTTTVLVPAPPTTVQPSAAMTAAGKRRQQKRAMAAAARTASGPPPWHRAGRTYATVSVRGSPPGKSWAIRQDAIGAGLVEGSRAEEIAKALAAQQKKKQDEEDEDDAEEFETVYDEDGNAIQRPKKKKKKTTKQRSRSPDNNQDGGGERKDGDHDHDHDDDGAGTASTASSAEPLTLDEVRSMYSKTARQRLRSGQQQQQQERMAMMRSMGGSSMLRRQRSFNVVGFVDGPGGSRSGLSSAIPSDDDTSTDTDDSDDDELDGDEFDVEAIGDDEAAGVAEAISAAKALLEERNRAQQQGAPFAGWSVGGGGGGASTAFVLTSSSSGGKNAMTPSSPAGAFEETAAMKRLNASLRNIARLCALGDVPQAIAIAAALVRELEAAEASSPQSSPSPSPAAKQPKQHHAGIARRQSSHNQQAGVVENSGPSPFTVLAARLRCTLGGLYLDIGEGAAAVAELSRAVLLAKRARQDDIYEHAVTLLGECYQTSGEEVAESFEAASSAQRKRGRAASVVRT